MPFSSLRHHTDDDPEISAEVQSENPACSGPVYLALIPLVAAGLLLVKLVEMKPFKRMCGDSGGLFQKLQEA